MQFPTVSGSNLQRQTRTLPRDFAGALNVVFVAFHQWHQRDVDSWLPFVADLEARHPDLDHYEIPVIREMNILNRTFINEGMRMGVRDTKARQNTVTLYTDKRHFRRALDIDGERAIHVLLVDAQGQVRWRTTGAFTPEKGEALAAAADMAERVV